MGCCPKMISPLLLSLWQQGGDQRICVDLSKKYRSPLPPRPTRPRGQCLLTKCNCQVPGLVSSVCSCTTPDHQWWLHFLNLYLIKNTIKNTVFDVFRKITFWDLGDFLSIQLILGGRFCLRECVGEKRTEIWLSGSSGRHQNHDSRFFFMQKR